MRKFDANSLALIKYQPQEILFLHKQTRKLYRYFNSHRSATSSQQISHPNLLSSIAFNQGVLYPKQQSTLLKEVELRKRSHSNSQFSEEEIVNTFLPLFKCVATLQQHKIIHGAIHLQNIVMIEEQVKLRDWHGFSKTSSQYYFEKVSLEDDMVALFTCFINCILLETTSLQNKQLDKVLQVWFQKFSKPFFVVLFIIVKKLREHFSDIVKLLEGQTKAMSGKLAECYEAYRLEREKKKAHVNGEKNPSILQFSQTKKTPFVAGKRVTHYQNIQNKVEGLQVKKINEKPSKVFQRNTHQLMTKKLNGEQKKIKEQYSKKIAKVPILNLSNAGIQNKSKRVQKERNSSFGIIRTFSKKK